VKASRLKLDDNARIITTPMTAKNGEGGNNKEHNITRVALITGSNTGVGFETAKSLAVTHGYEVILACRSEEKGRAASDAINVAIATINANQSNTNSSSTKGKAVFLRPLDLSDLDSVREFCQVVDSQYDTIHVLVNNAGKNTAASPVTSRQQSQISDEVLLDDIFTTNFLGHFLLTNLLLPKCRRIVNLSSVMHHFPIYSKNDEFSDISSIDFWKNNAIEPVQNDSTSASRDRKPYGPSKLAAVLFSIELNRRYGGGSGSDRRIRSIAVNPGSV
jgi:NAD(P)-dependent dehydrogenase (short-subunit alcohol dehydrogenase family)